MPLAIPKVEDDDHSFIQVTLSFVARSEMESILKKTSLALELSKILASKEISAGVVSSNMQRFNPTIPDPKRSLVGPRGRIRGVKKSFDEEFGPEDL